MGGDPRERAAALQRDAKLLFENGRFASCASLSVLAIEELAKFMGMIGAQPLPVRSWRSHPDKHVGSASFLLRKRYQPPCARYLRRRAPPTPTRITAGWPTWNTATTRWRCSSPSWLESSLTGRSVGSREPTLRRPIGSSSSGSTSTSTTRCASGQRHRRSLPSWRRDHLNFARDVLETLRSISLIWTASQR